MKHLALNILWIVLGVAVAGTLALGYDRLLRPRQAILPNPYSEKPDYDAVAKKVTGQALEDDLDWYMKFGSRFTASAGFRKLGDALIQRFEDLGYRVLTQTHEVTVPKTVFSRLLGEDGKPVPDLKLHPWYPNRLRTATTPPEGITGRVVFKGDPAEDDKIQALDQCAGNIILLRIRERFQDYANFGARAVLYYNDEAKDTKAWQFRRKESHASIDVPVFFVEGDAKSLIGKKVTIQARVDWKKEKVRNILAVLDPDPDFAEVRNETLLLSAYYDTWSPVPELAPGARQTLSLQALMLAAEQLANSPNRKRFRRKIVFFVAAGRGQAGAGSRHLMSALGSEPEPAETLEKIAEKQTEFREELERLTQLKELVPRYFREVHSRKDHARFWKGRKKIEKLFRDELALVLEKRAAAVDEEALQARVAWVRAGSGRGKELTAFLRANKKAQIYRGMANSKPYILPDGGGYIKYFEVPQDTPQADTTDAGAVRAVMDEASYREYLQTQVKNLEDRIALRIRRNRFYLQQLEENLAVFREIRGAQGLRRVAGLEMNFTDKTKKLVLGAGGWWWSPRCIPADREFALQFKYAQENLNPLVQDEDKFVSVVPKGDCWSTGCWYFSVNYFHSTHMVFNGYTSFVLITKGDDREFFATPMDTPDGIKWANVVDQERVILAGLEQIALGGAKIIPISMPIWSRDFPGVVTSVKGNSLVPNHPEPGAVVQLIGTFWTPRSWLHYTNGGGYYTAHMDPYPLDISDELGRFNLESYFAHRWWKVTFHAARSDPETGNIQWIRDLGYEQKYPTNDLRVYQVPDLVRIVMFRGDPINIFKAENPQKMKLYDRVEARLVRGFAKPRRYFAEQFYAGEYVLYLEPDAVFFPVFLSGAPHNPNLLRISGIGLNISPKEFETDINAEQSEVYGKGYLAADAKFLYHPEDDLARSMSAINTRRVLRYKKYDLLDEPTIAAAAKARRLAIEGARLRAADKQYEAFQTMKDSLAYSTNIHPVIRDSKSEAVYGIIFYLVLLIPFCFFMEKLLFGHPDIRYQMLLVGTIFLVVFFALRAIHPAFEIVRSSFMILLGFITLILSLMVTSFVGSKFRGAVMEYQKMVQGQQTTAEVTKASAAFTGFLLGINNMRKRKVRTALTAITLVLITFVMICFTAVENDYIEVEYPIGKAPYTGIEIRKNTLGHLGTQTTVLVNAFENDYDVAVRRWDVAGLWGLMPLNKKLEADTYISPEEVDNLPVPVVRIVDGKTLKWTSRGSMGIGPGPIFDVNAFLVIPDRWFKTESGKSCVLPLGAARKLGITPEMLKGDGPYPKVRVDGRDIEVINLFDETKLDAYRDRKDKPITPIDLAAEKEAKAREKAEADAREKAAGGGASKTTAAVEAEPKTPRTPAKSAKAVAASGEKTAAETANSASGKTAGDEAGVQPSEKPAREPIRIPAANLVLFPTQRQPRPEKITSHFKGKLRVNQKEPINFDRMFVTRVPPAKGDDRHKHYWFRDDDPQTCFIPARMAAEMRITPRMVETGDVRIMVQGTVLTVKGIYDGAVFDQIHDLDQESLAPYDVESIVGRPQEDSFEEDEVPEAMKRLSGSDIIICNDRSTTHGWHVASIAIDLSKLGSHKRIREVLDRYLEKTGAKAFYGIGTTAYFGARFRRPRGSNYLELLIPLLIASLTVLNTMRGSVYERQDEIYVYNAVGLNPFHIFFLFIAEACVYAVVGALGGYLLANFTGKLLGVLGWNAGLTINYSSIYAVMYSIVIMAAVLLSTWFPARAAARLAAPAEEMKWRVPDPIGDVISFYLPFTFSHRDRVAIVAYFMGWFDEFGEGSSAKFYAAPPSCAIEPFEGRVAAAVHVVTWLRPYDLGVSQEVVIHFTEDPENEMTLAHLTLRRLSGDISSWQRTNYLFLKLLRKHFLDWRMVPEDEKETFLERARTVLTATEPTLDGPPPAEAVPPAPA